MLSISQDKDHGREEATPPNLGCPFEQVRSTRAARHKRILSYLAGVMAAMVSSFAPPQSKSNLSHAEPGRARPRRPQASDQGQECRQKKAYSRRYAPGIGRYSILSSSSSSCRVLLSITCTYHFPNHLTAHDEHSREHHPGERLHGYHRAWASHPDHLLHKTAQ